MRYELLAFQKQLGLLFADTADVFYVSKCYCCLEGDESIIQRQVSTTLAKASCRYN